MNISKNDTGSLLSFKINVATDTLTLIGECPHCDCCKALAHSALEMIKAIDAEDEQLGTG